MTLLYDKIQSVVAKTTISLFSPNTILNIIYMKTKTLLIAFFAAFCLSSNAADPFYFEVISNPGKTVDYSIGFYHTVYTISTASDNADYVAYSGAIINNSTSMLLWSDYHIAVQLKNGSLIFNYITAATSGEYDCTFSLDSKETHHTKFCFHTVFKPNEIEKVYLFNKSTMKAFELMLSDAE